MGQNNAASSREPQRDQLLRRGRDHGATFAPLTRAVGGLSEVPHRVRVGPSEHHASSQATYLLLSAFQVFVGMVQLEIGT